MTSTTEPTKRILTTPMTYSSAIGVGQFFHKFDNYPEAVIFEPSATDFAYTIHDIKFTAELVKPNGVDRLVPHMEVYIIRRSAILATQLAKFLLHPRDFGGEFPHPDIIMDAIRLFADCVIEENSHLYTLKYT